MAPSLPGTADLLATLSRVFKEVGVRWYVFGAQAAIFYGSSRLTADIDVTIDLAGRSVKALCAALDRAGFAPQIPDDRFIATTRVVPFVHRITGMPVDVVLAGPGLEALFFARLKKVKLGRITIPVVSPEDLVVLKVLAARPQDLEDVRAVLGVQGTRLDRILIRDTLAQVESLLDQSDLVPLFDSLEREVKNPPARPRRKKGARRSRSTKRRGQAWKKVSV